MRGRDNMKGDRQTVCGANSVANDFIIENVLNQVEEDNEGFRL